MKTDQEIKTDIIITTVKNTSTKNIEHDLGNIFDDVDDVLEISDITVGSVSDGHAPIKQ